MLDRDLLTHMLTGRAVIVCVGNEWRGDEGVSHLIAGLLTPSERLSVVDCGETPENYLGVITGLKPDAVIVISAVGFGATPGEIRILKRREVGEFELSTLAPRLLIFTDYIEAQTGAATRHALYRQKCAVTSSWTGRSKLHWWRKQHMGICARSGR